MKYKPNSAPAQEAKAQHTKGIWHVKQEENINGALPLSIWASEHQRLALITNWDSEANAQRIVTAVNEYDELKRKEKLLHESISIFRKILAGQMANLAPERKLEKVYNKVEQLLKQAEQK